PLAIRPGYLVKLLPWLWRFWRASQPDHVRASTTAQAALMDLAAAETPLMLVGAGAGHMVHSDGVLHVYESEDGLRASEPKWQARAEHGIAFEHLHGAEAIARVQPGLSPALVAATYIPRWHTVADPWRLTEALANAFEQRGGRLGRAEAQRLEPGTDAVRVHRR